MSNVFGKKVVTSETAVRTQDRVGGAGIATGVYPGTVSLCYTKSSTDPTSQSITAIVKCKLEGDKTYETNLLICGREGQNFYTKESDGSQQVFEGYDALSDLAAFTAGITLPELTSEERTIEVRDYDTKTNKHVTVDAYPEVCDIPVQFMLQREKHNKQKRVEVNGKVSYVKLAETYEKTVLKRVLDENGFTFNERTAEAAEPEFKSVWLNLNEGKVYDATDKSLEAAKEAAVAPAKGTKKLFSK